jgi:signal transduction histidine kinase
MAMPEMTIPASVYESVFRTSSVGGYLLSASPEFLILEVNEAFLAATGRQRGDLLGQPLFVAFPESPEDSEGVAVLRRSLMKVLRTGRADSLPLQRYPIQVPDEHGGMRFEVRFWSAVNTPIRDAAGRVLCISHATIDVTDLVRDKPAAEATDADLDRRAQVGARMLTRAQVMQEVNRALEAERLRLMHLFENSPGIVYFTSGPDHVIDLANAAFYALVGQRDVLGKPLRESFGESQLECFIAQHDEVFRTGQAKVLSNAPVRLRRAPDEAPVDRIVDLVYQPIRGPTGQVIGICGLGNDITERRLAEAQVERSSRRKDEFIATLAHELRNPLAPIGNGIEILKLTRADDPAVQQTVALMDRQLSHLVRLVDDLLDVGRISLGKVRLDCARITLRAPVARAVEAMQPQVQARGHQLVVELPAEEVWVEADLDRLAQVFANLLSNAAKYTEPGGRIELRATVPDGQVQVSVRDNGIGIPEADVPRVFDLFSQVRTHQRHSEGGLGIGLALVHRLVELHGGSVSAHSAGEGRGSVFTVRLPRADPPLVPPPGLPATPGVADTAAPVPQPGARRASRILVADDNVDAAESLASVLRTLGHEVMTAFDGEQALACFESSGAEAVIMDLGMPRMDGLEAARRLRALPGGRSVRLIALTGWGQAGDRERTANAGFDQHLVKPVQLGALVEALR